MTHIDTEYTHIHTEYHTIDTNTHILHTFTHKLPHLWVGHKKSHVYIYIYIYIQQNQHIHTSNQLIQPSQATQYSPTLQSSIEKKFFNQKTNENQNQIIHS